MITHKLLLLTFALAISGILTQDLIATSDTTIEAFSHGTTDLQFKAIDSAAVPLYSVFEEPSKQSLAERIQSSILSPTDAQAVAALDSAKWISPGVGFYYVLRTPCFHNPCPQGVYTLYFSSSCSFVAYLVDQYGNYVQTIGSGTAWLSYAFKFYAPCGRYRIQIALKCKCCAYVRFHLYQNRAKCFDCPDAIRHQYNPETCRCECANSCPCNSKTQIWYGYPTCSCGCAKSLMCPAGQYHNKKTCQCQCLPKCCPKYQLWDAVNCRCYFPSGIIDPPPIDRPSV